jgi:hypothetical protein
MKCATCESLRNLILKLGKNNTDAKKYVLKLRKHICIKNHVEVCTIFGGKICVI